ncbi:ribonucleoside-diphosphate reductase, adenosylcobalamin-dependent [Dissulfurispira thermophila]|uniref:Vitamin B12-dependent ribonucleotide reductase n=1 Tax=Dissulfurispira thermophila TaxID=2715679 RepID=A0A7G1H213_9BACT|nr:adenosylcobalamin-dependent ribonucleoside-diphosphate reductase [Dissulfurispira thermophila]BCB96141.1 ribonucleoside-diphosphate reductase, adenosylcobalamin-dependent [Dissulfurispira thermophila]
MELTENALKVLHARYLLRDEKGVCLETPEDMFRRVARNIAGAERLYGEDASYWEDRFYELMTSLKFLPNSPALMNAGKSIGQLAACFVLPVEDSMKSIFDTLKNAALILQSGGGTGFSFSRLRPRADIVRSTGGIASGPVSFMKIYNTATEVIKQGGARRGANMGILRIDHPDIIEFIRVKRREGELTNFNISVAVTDEFMEALKNEGEYNLRNPRSGEIIGSIKAKAVFNEIIESAWETGDPGLIFIDRINRANPTPHIGQIESTNPCGEQPLLPYEACVLGSINLSKYIKTEDRGQKTEDRIDWDMLAEDIKIAVRFLDDSIDVNIYPLPEIEKMHKGNRKIGLGVMGWADMLILLGIPYNHKRAFEFARKIMKFIRDKSKEASEELAKKRGVFPNFKGSIYDAPDMPKVRNATTTTIAPTGTLSIIADCSSGIEPLFAIAYKRLVLDTELYEVNKYFVRIAEKRGFYSESLMNKVFKKGNLKGIKEIPMDVKRLFKTALEIPPEDHIEMQAAFQEYTDNAVSKTINLPNKAKKEDVEKAFILAYDKGVKGITVFRYGAKKGTLVKIADSD